MNKSSSGNGLRGKPLASRRALLGAVAALSLAATAARAEDVIHFGMTVQGNAIYAPLQAAEELGYYKDAGLKVDFATYRGATAGLEAMSAGAVDIVGALAAGAALAISKGAECRIVYAMSERPYGLYLEVKPDSPIKTMKDMAGKRVAISASGGLSDLVTLWAADRAGVKVQLVPVGAGAMLPTWQAGRVEGIPIWPGISLRLISKGEGRPIVDFGQEMDVIYPDTLIASNALIKARPDALRRFIGAVDKALTHMQNDPSFALQFLKSYTEETDDTVNKLVYEQVTLKQRAGGGINSADLKNGMRIAGKAWGIEDLNNVDPSAIYTFVSKEK